MSAVVSRCLAALLSGLLPSRDSNGARCHLTRTQSPFAANADGGDMAGISLMEHGRNTSTGFACACSVVVTQMTPRLPLSPFQFLDLMLALWY